MDVMVLGYLLGGALVGAGLGIFAKVVRDTKRKEGVQLEIKEKLADAQNKAKEILLEAKEEASKLEEEIKKDEEEKRSELRTLEKKLLSKEQSLDDKIENADKKKEELEGKLDQAKKLHEEAEEAFKAQAGELEKIAKMSKEEAREVLLKNIESEYKDDILAHYNKVEAEAREEVEARTKMLIAEAVQKYAMDVTCESTSTTVQIPSDDMKGRIIGREGRNIQTFEKATGVDVIVDDTPGAVAISSFDLMRRYVAKISLERLVSDGRIQPARIEETVEVVKDEVDKLVKEIGERAVYDTGVSGLHPALVKSLGKLKFRTIRGQNVLKHSMHVANLAANMASEIKADPNLCKKAGLLFHIGRSADHEVQGTYAKIGSDILKKYNLPEEVVHVVSSGDESTKPKSAEAMLVQAADIIAQNRPGANEDSMQNHIQRMSELEEMATKYDGVDSAFAIQAGNKIRIIVDPEEIDDLQATKLSHDIARKVEKDMGYMGQVKVHVIRETRQEDYAT